MKITPDFSEASEDLGSLPDGTYKTRIVEVEPKQSAKGNSYLKWKLQVFGGEGDIARYNNWPVFYNTMLEGPGSGMLKKFLKCAMNEEVAGEFDSEMLLGREIEVTVQTGKDEMGRNRKWPDVKAVAAIQI